MKHCPECGRELWDEAVECIQCGAGQNDKYVLKADEDFGVGYTFCGFLVPPLGIFFYFFWRKTYRTRARCMLKGALTALITYVVFLVIYFFLIHSVTGW